VKDNIYTEKYNNLTKSSDRLAYLRSLAINTLVTEAAAVFIKNEEAILKGDFSESLLNKSKYKAQIEDIIKISVEKIYKSKEVTDKEIAGYKILQTLLDVYTTSAENLHNNRLTHYDQLILKNLSTDISKSKSDYEYLMEACNYISRLTDGNALLLFQKINGIL
jgi:dGTPase